MSDLISREAAQQPSPVAALRRIALETLAECDEGYCLSLKGFLSRCGTPIHPEIVRGIMADLRQDGLVMHCRGLMTEDGEMAGSGWGITPAGEAFLRALPPAQEAAPAQERALIDQLAEALLRLKQEAEIEGKAAEAGWDCWLYHANVALDAHHKARVPPSDMGNPISGDLISRAAMDAREVFSDSCSAAGQAIDYLEQRILAALPSQQAQGTGAPASLEGKVFVVQHSPNCPSPWLVRLHGKSAVIDMKPYFSFTGETDLTRDALGFGKTFEEAADNALKHAAQIRTDTAQKGGA